MEGGIGIGGGERYGWLVAGEQGKPGSPPAARWKSGTTYTQGEACHWILRSMV